MHDSAIELRHELHRRAELSGEEVITARIIVDFFRPLSPDGVIEGLGGHGVAIIFAGIEAGPTVLLRCDMDALPIKEPNQLAYVSHNPGVSHKCGHDGHMAILAALGAELAANRPVRGRVVLLFQPAEETGQGAAAVIDDPTFESIRPDFAFALHNLPGYPLGEVVIKAGAFNCASRGMEITLRGRTAHAAQPETGLSPAASMCEIIQALASLPAGISAAGELALVTVVGAKLGKKAFGTAPGHARVWATLRSETDQTMSALIHFAEQLVQRSAESHGLKVKIGYEDVFPAVNNSEHATRLIIAAADPASLRIAEQPFSWSEDFGRIAASCEGALFGVGAGLDVPDLHNPDYDFPDALIRPARDIFLRIVSACLDD